MSVGDHQGYACQAPGDQAAQERQPAGAVFAGDHIQPEDLAVPVTVHADRDDHGDVDDAAALADLLGQGVHPHIRVGPRIQGPVPEPGDHLVELAGHARYLGLRQ
jgi:hypothetical protein